MAIYIQAYKRSSQSAKLLCKAMDIPLLKEDTKIEEGSVIINWGSSTVHPNFDGKTMAYLNAPDKVKVAMNKINTLEVINGLNPYPFFTSYQNVEAFFQENGWAEGRLVYCRTLVESSKGKGIVVATNMEELINAKLYTLAYPCKREYRVHVFSGNVIDLTAKVILKDKSNPKYKEEPDPLVRSSETGYIFARDAVKIPDKVKDTLQYLATQAVSYLGLSFGAVDIVRDIHDNYSILEVNTAPGITGTALQAYLTQLTEAVSSVQYHPRDESHLNVVSDMPVEEVAAVESIALEVFYTDTTRAVDTMVGYRREAQPVPPPVGFFSESSHGRLQPHPAPVRAHLVGRNIEDLSPEEVSELTNSEIEQLLDAQRHQVNVRAREATMRAQVASNYTRTLVDGSDDGTS